MKIRSLFTYSAACAIVLAFVASASAQSPVSPADMRMLRSDGDPTNVVTALKGQFVADVSSSAVWYQPIVTGTTGFVKIIDASGKLCLALTATPTATIGQVVVTATSANVYLTATTGLIVKSGTVTTF